MLSHPLLDPGGLRVPPISAALAAALIVMVVSRLWPGPGPSGPPSPHTEIHSWHGSLSRPMILTRAVAIVVLVGAVVAGRFGSRLELENPAPALVVGTLWPMLILASAIVGSVWRWLDPWDGLARPVAPTGDARGDVRWAALPALALVWYLGSYPTPLDPRTVGLTLAAYSILTLGGCLAIGRRSWLSRVELFGLVFGWTALFRRGVLTAWRPPRGAIAVLGVLAAGLTFGAIRRSTLWGGLNVAEHALVLATGGVLAAAGAFVLVLWWARKRADAVGSPGSVAAAMVPPVAAIAIALALSRNRLFTSVQLLPSLLVDPLSSGGDSQALSLDPDPLGSLGLVALQVGILLAGHLAGALVLARRTGADRRRPGTVALAVSVGMAVAATTAAQV